MSKTLSKLMALVLRHAPERLGLTLDRGGWTEVDALLEGLAAAGHRVTRNDIEQVVATSEKQRFALSSDGQRIRANQGHSVEVDLGYAAASPPARLYHGTAATSVEVIMREGLRPMQRHHVHLSPDEDTARAVGSRHGRPVVLAVDAARMERDGHTFMRSCNGVWLAERVPPEYLSLISR